MKKIFTAAFLFLLAANAGASTQVGDSTRVRELQELQVVSNRASRTTPIAFTNVSGEQLRRANTGKDIPYLLNGTPSLITTSDAGAGIGYTTMRIRGTDATRINVTANGIPMNDSESNSLFWVDMPDLAASISDIQIQRGVGTSTNGGAAFGASVNMRTEVGAERPYGELNAAYGSFNTRKLSLKAGTGLMENGMYFDTRLSHISSSGYLDRASADLNSYYAQAGYMNDRTHIRMLVFGGLEETYHAWDYASKEDMAEHGRTYNPCGVMTDSTYYKNQIDYYLQTNTQLLIDHRIAPSLNLYAGLHYTRGEGYYEQYKNAKPEEYGLIGSAKTGLVRRKHVDSDFGGAIFALTYNKQPLQLTWGGGLNRYVSDHYGNVLWVQQYAAAGLQPEHEYYRNMGRKTDGNTYLKGTYNLTRALQIYADAQYRYVHYSIGGRNDVFDYNTGAMQSINSRNSYHFFNPKAGVSYEVADNQRLYASIGVSHKEPTRNSYTDYTGTDYFGNIPYNPYPKAERLIDYELGYQAKGKQWSAGINLYFMDYDNQFVSNGALNNIGEPVVINVPRSYRAGVEVEAAWKPVQCFSWSANATFSRNRIRGDYTEQVIDDWWSIGFEERTYRNTTLAFSPSVVANNVFSFHCGGFSADLHSQYVSRQYLTNTETRALSLDPYFVSNLALRYSWRNIEAGCTIYNIFNEEYENNGWGSTAYDPEDTSKLVYYSGYAAQAGTHVMGSLTVRF